jgi:ATP-binding cassette, subfamily B (MDR/TAP), member 1
VDVDTIGFFTMSDEKGRSAEQATAKHDLTQTEPLVDRGSSHSTDEDVVKEEKPKLDLKKLDSQIVTPKDKVTKTDPFADLPAHQAEVLRKQVDTAEVKPGLAALYRYADRKDYFIIGVAALCSIAAGAALPLMTVIFGGLQNTFQNYFLGLSTYDDFTSYISHLCLYFIYLAIAEFVGTYVGTVGFIYTGENIAKKMREHYLESCLRQNIGFFDNLGAGEITTRITADTNLIQEGISEKVALTLTALATFFAAIVIGFVTYWKLALILLAAIVALFGSMAGGSRFIVKYSKESLAAYAQGGSVADEVISSVRNAQAFGTQDRLARQYDSHLVPAERAGFRSKAAIAIMIALLMFIVYAEYGLAFWTGSIFITNGEIQVRQVLIVAMSTLIGAFSLGGVAPNIQAFASAVAAAGKIYSTIDRISPLDPSSDNGAKMEHLRGEIRLDRVTLVYPSRPEVTAMKDVSLTIPAGKVTALVGASGSGKSTVVGLIERFYSPVEGNVLLDGVDISTLNLRWLRQQVAIVSQEPTLFGTSIFNNIRHGLIGTQYEAADDAKVTELVHQAARKANAHDFITSLPEGYETNVGERGFLLSGGQKQRVCIARAVISDPRILLLDEATSALDTKSEGVVQRALETASEGRTTVMIAHRLSTIRDAHNIVVMSHGSIVEQGTHDDLLERRGAYFNLVTAQNIAAVNETSSEEQEAIDKEDEELIRQASKTGGSELQAAVDPDDLNIADKLKRTATQKSVSSLALQGRKSEVESSASIWTLGKLILSFNRKEMVLMWIGFFFSIICGGGNPVSAVFFAKMLSVLSVPINSATIPGIKHDSSFWSLMYLMLAIVQLIAFAAQGILFSKCSERLVHRVRDTAFRHMLRQDVEFFDKDENSAGALTSFLSTEATHVAGLSGVTLGTILLTITTLVAACTVALVIGWKLALVCIATIPVVIVCGFFRFWMLSYYQRRSKSAYAKSASYASEAISAIRTVASLTREQDVLRQYKRDLAIQQRSSIMSVAKTSTLYASAQSLTFLAFALGFWYGSTLIARFEYNMFQFFVVFSSVIFGAQSAGQVFSFAPDMGKAVESARALKALFDRKPSIDTWSTEGQNIDEVNGTIEFRVSLSCPFTVRQHPSRPVRVTHSES